MLHSGPISYNWHWLIVYWSAHFLCTFIMAPLDVLFYYFLFGIFTVGLSFIIYQTTSSHLHCLAFNWAHQLPKSALSFWEWLPIIHIYFRSVNYPNCRLAVCLYLFLLHMCPRSLMDVPASSASSFDVDYHWASSLPPVTLSAPFDVSCVHIQIEFLIRRHYLFDFSPNEKSDLWHLALTTRLGEELTEVMDDMCNA